MSPGISVPLQYLGDIILAGDLSSSTGPGVTGAAVSTAETEKDRVSDGGNQVLVPPDDTSGGSDTDADTVACTSESETRVNFLTPKRYKN